jgi:hypothetical protein
MQQVGRLSTALVVLLVGGCSELDNCPNAQADVVATSGTTTRTSTPELSSYESSAPDGPLLPFPAKTRLRLQHDLGFTPLYVHSSLSFDPNGTAGAGSITAGSGNPALIDCKDDHSILVRNDTCEDFYIYVTASWIGSNPREPCDTE